MKSRAVYAQRRVARTLPPHVVAVVRSRSARTRSHRHVRLVWDDQALAGTEHQVDVQVIDQFCAAGGYWPEAQAATGASEG